MINRHHTYILLLSLCSLFFAACDDDDKLPAVSPTDHGTVVDNMGNTYNWVRIGDLQWTTSNACNGPDIMDVQFFDRLSWDYVSVNEDYYYDTYLPRYGNLMNHAAAVASAPDGWRLPTDEDWQKLERCLGMTDTAKRGPRGNGQAFRLQEVGEGTELAMSLAGAFILEPVFGYMRLPLNYVEVYGFYWTSTIDDSSSTNNEEMAYYRKFFKDKGQIWRESCSAQQLMSVRWVKDVE